MTPGLVTTRRLALAASALVVLLVGGWNVLGLGDVAEGLETVDVTRGTFDDRATIRGEIRALRSQIIAAPSGAGDLRILEIAPDGGTVRKGDVLVAFDASTLKQRLDERQSDLRASAAEIARAEAEGRLKLETVTTDRVTAEFDIERARLDVRAGELQSRYDEQKARLSLSDREQKLRETDAVLASGQAAISATVGSLEGKLERAQAEVGRSSRGLQALVVRAPSDGVMVIFENWRAGQFGNGARPFQVGDSAWAGAQIAELPDLATARMTAMVDEVDRSRLATGQQGIVRIDAIGDAELPARLVSIGTIARSDFSSGWPPKRGFEIVLELERTEPRLRPGMTAVARLQVGRHENQVLVPSRALFPHGARTVAYVVGPRRLEPRLVRVAFRTDEVTAVAEGLRPGERVVASPPGNAAELLAALDEEPTS